MKSLQDSIRRIINHIDYIVGLQIRIFYVFTLIFSAIISYAFYSSPSMSLSLLPFFFFIYVALISALATEPVDELSKGTIQVYLATGLTRKEYYSAWLFGGIVFQTIVFLLIYSIPALIIDPSILVVPVKQYGLNVSLEQLLIICALQTIYYGTIGMTIGAFTKRRSLAVFAVFLLMVIIPFSIGLLASIFTPSLGEGIFKGITLICNQLLYVAISSYSMVGVFGMNPYLESVIILIILDIIFILLSYMFWREVDV